MSIVTRTGDDGTTALMYGRRVPKNHPRIEVCGSIDELNAALGLARAAPEDSSLASSLLQIQQDLVTVMGELATASEDLDRYTTDGFSIVNPAMTERLDQWVRQAESEQPAVKDWVMPGANAASAALDMARTVCRRAERRVAGMSAACDPVNPAILTYLNRLADLLWLWARKVERN